MPSITRLGVTSQLQNWLARVKTRPLSFYHCLFLYNYGPTPHPPHTLCCCFDPPTPFSSSSLGAHVGVMGLVEVHVGQLFGAYGHQPSSGWALSWAPWGTPRDMGVERRLPPTGCPHQGSEAPLKSQGTGEEWDWLLSVNQQGAETAAKAEHSPA